MPFPSAGDLPDPGIEPESPELASGFSTSELPGKPRSGTVRKNKDGAGTEEREGLASLLRMPRSPEKVLRLSNFYKKGAETERLSL